MRGAGRERMIRVLLTRPDGTLTKYRVAKLSGCSIAWTMEYLDILRRKKLVKGTKVLDFGALIDFWSGIARRPRPYDFFVADPEGLLEGVGLEYALTTYRAENILNHYLFPSRTDVYIHADDFAKWKSAIVDSSGLVGSGNLRLLVGDDHAMYGRSRIRGLWVASIPQVLLDLKLEGGVAIEAYEMMVEKHVQRL